MPGDGEAQGLADQGLAPDGEPGGHRVQRLVGVVENMSWLELPTGERMEVFGSGGGQTVADSLTRLTGAAVPLLGQIPLDTRVRESGDAGTPIVLAAPDAPAAVALIAVADRLAVRRETLAGKPLGLRPAARG